MKKTLFVFSILTLGLVGFAPQAQAKLDVSFNMVSGVPIYTEPAPYYTTFDDPYWLSTPVRVVIVDGVPHRMHYWRGRWYDEGWRRDYRRDRRYDRRDDRRDERRDDRHDDRRDLRDNSWDHRHGW